MLFNKVDNINNSCEEKIPYLVPPQTENLINFVTWIY